MGLDKPFGNIETKPKSGSLRSIYPEIAVKNAADLFRAHALSLIRNTNFSALTFFNGFN